jgi:hypothetical protein
VPLLLRDRLGRTAAHTYLAGLTEILSTCLSNVPRLLPNGIVERGSAQVVAEDEPRGLGPSIDLATPTILRCILSLPKLRPHSRARRESEASRCRLPANARNPLTRSCARGNRDRHQSLRLRPGRQRVWPPTRRPPRGCSVVRFLILLSAPPVAPRLLSPHESFRSKLPTPTALIASVPASPAGFRLSCTRESLHYPGHPPDPGRHTAGTRRLRRRRVCRPMPKDFSNFGHCRPRTKHGKSPDCDGASRPPLNLGCKFARASLAFNTRLRSLDFRRSFIVPNAFSLTARQ